MQRQGTTDADKHGLVEPVCVGHLVHLALRSQLGQRLAEPDLTLLLATERGVTHGHQHPAGEAGPLGDQVRRRGAGRPVVDPDVRRLVARADVRDERDGGDACPPEPIERRGDLRGVGGLQDHPVRPAMHDVVQHSHRCRRVAVLAQRRSRAHDRRTQGSELGLQSVARSARESIRSLHDQIEDECPRRELDLFVLALELCDGTVDLSHRLRPNTVPAVQHPVDRRSTESGLPRDIDNAMSATWSHPSLPPDLTAHHFDEAVLRRLPRSPCPRTHLV